MLTFTINFDIVKAILLYYLLIGIGHALGYLVSLRIINEKGKFSLKILLTSFYFVILWIYVDLSAFLNNDERRNIL